MAESAGGQVGNLLGQIRAETVRLEARIQYAPESLRTLANQTIDQQKPLIDDEFVDLIAREDWAYSKFEDRLLISKRRSEWTEWARNQIDILRNLNNAIKYDEHDYTIIANNVFLQLCSLGQGSYNIRTLAENLGAYPNKDDITYIAETVLVSMGYIEHDPQTHQVRLTLLGSQNCARGIEIPPSDIQRLRSTTS